MNSGAGRNLKVEGHNFRRVAPENFFYCAPPLFRGAPHMTGHYEKVQGAVTRTELGQWWRTVRGQSYLLTFQGHAVSEVTSPTESLGGFIYRSSVDNNSVLCSVSEIGVLHVNLQTYFGQFRGTLAHTLVEVWRLEAMTLKGFGHPHNTWLLSGASKSGGMTQNAS